MPINETIVNRLPAEAAAKLRRLENQRNDATALANGTYERLRELQQEALRSRDEVDRLQAADRQGELVREARGEWHEQKTAAGTIGRQARIIERDTARLTEASEKLKRTKATLAEAQERMEELSARGSALDELIRRAQDWVKRLPDGATIKTVKVSPPRLKKGKTVAEALADARNTILKMKAAIDDAKTAPVHSSEAMERARTIVERMAAEGRPTVLDLIEGGSQIQWPMIRVNTAGVNPASVGSALVPDAMPMLSWLFKDKMIKALQTEITELADDTNALAPAERATKITDLRDKMLAAERTEEALCEAAEEQGLTILRRRDIDVRALMAVDGPVPKI